MDYFNGKTDQDFIKFYKDELYSITEFEYTHDYEKDGEFEPDFAYGYHITASYEKLKDYVKSVIREKMNYLSVDDETKLIKKKLIQISDTISTEIDTYISKIKVDYK
jgi:hypothetical protein